MKNFKKIVFATFGKWNEIFLVTLFQIISVPIILSKWSAELLAVWVLLQTIMMLINLPFTSFSIFIYNENLKLGFKKKKHILRNISSSIPFLLISLIIIFFLIVFINFHFDYEKILKIPSDNIQDFQNFILYFTIITFLTTSLNEFLVNYLNIYGHYVYISWIRGLRHFIISFFPLVAILFGYEFFEAGLCLILSNIFSFFIFFSLIYNRLGYEKFKLVKIDFKLGIENYIRSFLLMIKHFIEGFNATYIRFLIIGMFSLSALSLFFTLRALSGLVRQIVFSVIEPLTVEMMSEINKKNNKNYNKYFTIYYFYIIILIFPCCIALQYFAPLFFEIWTLKELSFDANIFMILVVSSLVISLNIPFKIIIDSFNLNLINLFILILSILSLSISVLYFKESYGILGLCFSILIYELVYLFLIIFFAHYQYKKLNLNWPKINLIFGSLALILFCLYSLFLTEIILINNMDIYKYLIMVSYFCLIILFFKFTKIKKILKNLRIR